ncbi:MAG: extracellular solute-binding protein [Bacillales bacterium]|nr:extracellular solute-binding protein [Bacillales bacterium]
MKKMFVFAFLLTAVLFLAGCTQKEKLYVLNFGDYINDELIDSFEDEYNCKVVYTELNSNEEMYQKMKNEDYDIVIVSDYMIDRLYQEGLIVSLDYTQIPNYDFDGYFTQAQNLINNQCTNFKNYFVPYFWGTVGIMYNTNVEGLEEYVEANGLSAIFTDNGYKKGMYNSSRDALSMALLYNGYDINSNDDTELNTALNTLIAADYEMWGDDSLKQLIQTGQLDLAMVYSGDYLDELYTCEINEETPNFGYFAPESTNIWIDGMCLTSVCQNADLAYSFMNYFNDTENCAENAAYIGYAPLSETVYNLLYTEYDYDYDASIFFPYPEGSTREMYHYVSIEHYNKLNDLLDRAKNN